MSDLRSTWLQLGEGIVLPTGQAHTITVVCVSRIRLVGLFFDLDKCFLLPSAVHGMRTIKQVYDAHPGANLLIVGHTDTSGRDSYNVKLSVERADAVAAYLTDSIDPWEAFFNDKKPSEKRWGALEVQHMLTVLPEGGGPYYDGVPNGREDARHTEAVQSFQRAQGLDDDGIAGPQTRHALIREYMAIAGTTLSAGTRIVTHGCGENFPVDETGDNVQLQENRRVEVFVFDDPIDPPAPPPPNNTSARGSTLYPRWLAQVEETTDVTTGAKTTAALQLSLLSIDDLAIPDIAYKLTFDDGTVREGRVDRNGQALVPDAPALPFTLEYADPDDMRAKVFAARMDRAARAQDLATVLGVLSQSKAALAAISTAYQRYYDQVSGKGIAADARDLARGTEAESTVEYLIQAGELEPSAGPQPPIYAYSEPAFENGGGSVTGAGVLV